MLAHYDFRSRCFLEELADQGNFSLSAIAKRPKVISPEVPAELASAWRNINTPADLGCGASEIRACVDFACCIRSEITGAVSVCLLARVPVSCFNGIAK